jgi:hypothetical protein
MSLKEQETYYETLLGQYKRETELIESYKHMCQFDMEKLESMPASFGAASSDPQAAAVSTLEEEERMSTSVSACEANPAETIKSEKL